MSKLSKFFIHLIVLALILTPVLSLAQTDNGGLIPCGRTINGIVKEECQFNHVMDLINEIVKFALFTLALPIAAIMFAYAGVSLIISGSAEGKTKAKNIFVKTVIGLVLALASWLIVNTILMILGYDGDWIGF
jgi:hypothetical protein